MPVRLEERLLDHIFTIECRTRHTGAVAVEAGAEIGHHLKKGLITSVFAEVNCILWGHPRF
jgi:hypothetical protein